jgi:hypothetical protein
MNQLTWLTLLSQALVQHIGDPENHVVQLCRCQFVMLGRFRIVQPRSK